MNNETIRFLIEIFIFLIMIVQLHLIRRSIEDEKVIIISNKDIDEFAEFVQGELEKIEYVEEEHKDDN